MNGQNTSRGCEKYSVPQKLADEIPKCVGPTKVRFQIWCVGKSTNPMNPLGRLGMTTTSACQRKHHIGMTPKVSSRSQHNPFLFAFFFDDQVFWNSRYFLYWPNTSLHPYYHCFPWRRLVKELGLCDIYDCSNICYTTFDVRINTAMRIILASGKEISTRYFSSTFLFSGCTAKFTRTHELTLSSCFVGLFGVTQDEYQLWSVFNGLRRGEETAGIIITSVLYRTDPKGKRPVTF